MKDEKRTKKELIEELDSLRSALAGMELPDECCTPYSGGYVSCDLLLDTVTDLAYICDDKGNVLYLNRAFERLSGRSREEFTGKSFAPLFSGDGLKTAVDNYTRTLKGESPCFEVAFKDTGVVCEYRNTPYRDGDGSIIGVLGIARDVTEQRHAEQALAESRHMYHSLFENMLSGAAYQEMVFDENGAPVDYVFLEVNNAFETHTGLKKDELIGRRVTEVIPGIRDARPDLVAIYGHVAQTGEGTSFELYFEPLKRWFTVSAYCPERGFFVTTFSDITERKAAEDKLRHAKDALEAKVEERTAELTRVNAVLSESESLYRRLVDTIPYGVQENDASGRITFSNPAHARTLGYAEGELVGRFIWDLYETEEDREALRRYFTVLVDEQPPPIPYYGKNRTGDGRLIDVKVDWDYKRDASGRLTGFISVITDITEQRSAEREVEARLHYVRSMNEINENFEETKDLDSMLTSVLEKMLSIFDCSRAWLLYPVDLTADSFTVPYQVTTPEFPVEGIVEIPVKGDDAAVEVYREALASREPLTFTFDLAELPEGTTFTNMVRDFQIRSQMVITLHPKVGKPWMLGLHQCTHAREWTPGEQRLFKDISARISDAVTGALLYKDLMESEQKYSTIFGASNDAIMLFADGVFIDCNDATLRVFGCSSRDEFIGRHPGEWSPPVQGDGRDSVEAADERIKAAFREGRNFFEWTHRRAGGEEFPAEVLLTPMHLDGRDVIQATVRDITERKRAEEEIGRNFQVQRALGAIMRSSLGPAPLAEVLDVAIDAILSVPAFSLLNKGSIFLADDAGERLKLVVERGLPEALLEMCASVPFGSCICGRAASTRKVVYTERVGAEHEYRYRGIMPHGHYCAPIIMGSRVLGVINAYIPEGHRRIPDEQRFLTMAADTLAGIIERKRGEDSLRLHSEMIANMAEGVALVRPGDAVIIHTNLRFEEMFGYAPGELVGQAVSVLNASQPGDRGPDEVKSDIVKALGRDGAWSGEVRNIRKDGTPFWCRATVSTYTSEMHGEVWLGIHEDITGQKAAEEERERLEAQLIQSQKMEAIGTLAGGVAHDFNNIMTVVKNLTALALRKAEGNAAITECLEPVCEVSERAVNLVQQLLIFSQSRQMSTEPLSLNDTVDGLMVMLRSLVSEDISLEMRLAGGLWEVESDRVRLEQVLTNLIVNSRDAMPEGGRITITTENVTLTGKEAGLVDDARPGNFVRLVVEDTGCGMSPDTVIHVFEPFFTTKSPEGTGLGLSVVYGIVRELGGWIGVESQEGSGTSFIIYMPAMEEHEAQAPEETAEKKVHDGGGRRILLVEDDKWVRRSTAMVLEENGYAVTEAANAEDAIRLFYREKGRFDLVLSDVVMPGRSGLQMLSPLLDVNPRVPILLFSGHLDDKVELGEIMRRGIAYIHKPFEIEELLGAVEETIERD